MGGEAGGAEPRSQQRFFVIFPPPHYDNDDHRTVRDEALVSPWSAALALLFMARTLHGGGRGRASLEGTRRRASEAGHCSGHTINQYWKEYNIKEGWAGEGWCPCNILPPYTMPQDRNKNTHCRLHVNLHRKAGTRYEFQTEWLRWPDDFTWERTRRRSSGT